MKYLIAVFAALILAGCPAMMGGGSDVPTVTSMLPRTPSEAVLYARGSIKGIALAVASREAAGRITPEQAQAAKDALNKAQGLVDGAQAAVEAGAYNDVMTTLGLVTGILAEIERTLYPRPTQPTGVAVQ